MKKIVMGGLAALAIGSFATSAMAAQGFENRLHGATIGLPLGALPPPGLYTGLETAYLGMIGNRGASVGPVGAAGLALPALAQAVPLLYVPGWHFLGANYAMSVVFAFYENSLCGAANTGACSTGPFGGGNNNGIATAFTTANPTFNPITLSWNLGGGWFVSGGLNFMAPIGTRSLGTPNPDYWTVEPAFAVSYLANNWVISGNFFYDINGNSPGVCCGGTNLSMTPGNTFWGDLTALYKIGKWELGPVGDFQVQTTADTGTGCLGANPRACANITQVAVGGLVGYDFGPVDLQFWTTVDVADQNSPSGPGAIFLWTRLGFRLWGPEAPKPLVAKN